MFLFRTWSTVRLVAVLLSLGIHQSNWKAVSYHCVMLLTFIQNIVIFYWYTIAIRFVQFHDLD